MAKGSRTGPCSRRGAMLRSWATPRPRTATRARRAALRGGEDAGLVAQRLGEVVGLSDRVSGAEETFRAVRTFVETLARRKPLVLVFDDIPWGEPTFLDLVDHVTDWTNDAPVLLVCVARPELLDVR